MRIEESAVLRAAQERVWEVLVDWERQASWMPDVAWIRVVGPGRGLGAKVVVRTKLLGVPAVTDELTITAWEPPTGLAVEHSGLVRGTGEWRLAPAEGGTRFIWREALRMPPPVLGDLALLAYSPVQRWMLRRSIRNLRRIVQSTA